MTDELKILCPYCNAPYTASMLQDYEDNSFYCETCGNDQDITVKTEIKCTNCDRVVYVKESKLQEF